ncbi:MAG: hypothetical protein JNJ99_15315, partial [Crocinitomicaceae bacterium]|nr:hypothetical protein [Crocinitomicaceae bacterium]
IYFPVWGESFGSGADESMNRITSDANDNIIYTAFFMDSTQIEIGGSNVDVVTMDWDYLLVKSDPNGSGLWYHLYPGNGQLFDVDVHGTDIYTTGLITSGTMDIDPGPGTLNVSSTTTSSFCQKLDENGNLIWGKGFTGSGQITAEDLATDDAGNVYISGEIYNGTIDIDPGPSTVNVTTSNRIMFVVKLDINGNYVWHHAYPGDDISITYLKTSPNYLYLYGTYQGTYDFDPGPGVDSETAVGNGDALLHKIDFSGNLIWSKRIGGLTGTDVWDRNSIENIVTDDQENIYMVGYYASDMDVDPNIGVTTIPGFCTDCARIFAAKWDVNGNYVWSYYTESSLAGGSRLVPNDIYLSSSNSALVFGGYAYYYPPFGTIDFLPGSGSFNQSFGEYGGSFFIHTDTSGNFIWSEMRTNQSIYDFSSSNDTVVIGGQFFETQNIGTPQSPIMVAATPNTFLPFNYPEGFMAKLYFEFGNLYANVFTTPTTNADSCDAFAYAFPIGGFPPYTFDWITQTDYDNSFELDSACYGIHTLLVMDSAGDSAFVDYYVAEDSGYSNWSYGIPSDTVYFIHENCLLDYSLPIDSAAITAFDYLMDDSLTTGQYFYGEVVYYQNGNVYTFGDTVLVDLDLNVLFFLSVYCP